MFSHARTLSSLPLMKEITIDGLATMRRGVALFGIASAQNHGKLSVRA